MIAPPDLTGISLIGASGNDSVSGNVGGDYNRIDINAGQGTNDINLSLQDARTKISAGAGADVIKLTGTGLGYLFVSDEGGDNNIDLSGLTFTQSSYDVRYYGGPSIVTGTGSDTILGSSGDEIISNGGGQDIVNGGGGRDQITGGAGADSLTGGSAIDTFMDSVANMNGDRITDYQYSERILLTQNLSSAAQVRLSSIANSFDARLEIDANNDGVFETAITLAGQVSGRVVVTSEGDYTNNLIRIVEGGIIYTASSIAENNTAGSVVANMSVMVPDATIPGSSEPYSYALVAGPGDIDNSTFSISGSELRINNVADFETKTSYTIRVGVTDATGVTCDQVSIITVNDVNEAPSISSNGAGSTASVSIIENSTVVTTVTVTDPDAGATLAYSIIGGADSAKLQIDTSTGVLSFINAPNFEAPTDAGGNNVYDVTVQVSNGSLTDTQAIAVTVTNQSPEDVVGTSGVTLSWRPVNRSALTGSWALPVRRQII